MIHLNEYQQKTEKLTDLLPWAILACPGVVLNKDGSFQQTLRFRGPDLESSTDSQLVGVSARINNALKRLGSGWSIFVEARRQVAQGYPQNDHFPDTGSTLLDAERRHWFGQSDAHYESEYFLTFVHLPEREALSKVGKLFLTETETGKSHSYQKLLDYFCSTVERLGDIIKESMYELIQLDDESTLTYLHQCISTQNHRVRVPDVPAYLDGVLADTPLTGGLEPKLGDAHLRVITIMGFPAQSVPAILDQLNHLPIEYRWMSRYIPLDKLEAQKTLKNYRRQWFSKRKGMMSILNEVFTKAESPMQDSAALRKAQDADQASLALDEDQVSYGYYTATVVLTDTDANRLEEKLRNVERVINGLGFTTIKESTNAIEAWLSSLPGHTYANVRMPLVHSLNLAHLLPFSAIWSGPTHNNHFQAPVLFHARTTGNTPFRFCNHIGDVGHQLIMGPTGTGKSVLLNFMALQFLRYDNAQVFIFDKGGSFLASTFAVGGSLYEIGEKDSGLVFQPLAHINQMSERVWGSEWVQGLLEAENITLNPNIKSTVWDALNQLAGHPQDQRTLSGLCALLQDQNLRQALEPYTLAGPYGHILDAHFSKLDQYHWHCFELDRLMQSPKAIGPVLGYLFHLLEERFDGRPTMLVLDEGWQFLDHPIFANKIKEWLKTLRKKNVSVIFATQSINDALKSPIMATLMEACPSRVFLPNERALEPAVQADYHELGLNDRQNQLLAHATLKEQYYFESQAGNALFSLDLGPLALALCAVSSTLDKKSLREQYLASETTCDFLVNYLKSNDLDWAVDLIKGGQHG